MATSPHSTPQLRDYIAWDVYSWAGALSRWESYVPAARDLRVLEIGAHGGGISLYWAMRGCRVVCSDYESTSPKARELHERFGVSGQITYAQVDVTSIPLDEGEFDIVCFKSVLGGVGKFGGLEGQRRALQEIHRVLKPGGRLVFAENMVASPLHRFFRRRFVQWGGQWRYLTLPELDELLKPFTQVELDFRGILATFGRREWQRSALHGVDLVLQPLIPDRWKYVAIGCATKPAHLTTAPVAQP